MYKLLSDLLSYPDETVTLNNDIIRSKKLDLDISFKEFQNWYTEQSLPTLQEDYTATFDCNPEITLNLFEYIHGCSNARGGAMAALIEEYYNNGFILLDEVPDHLPVLLEYISEVGIKSAVQPVDIMKKALPVLTELLVLKKSKYSLLTNIINESLQQKVEL